MRKLIRAVLCIPPAKISRQDAIKLAADFFRHKGATLTEPEIYEHLRYWEILLSRRIKGSAWVHIDNQTGEVKRFGFPNR